jgi:hypothetical protein
VRDLQTGTLVDQPAITRDRYIVGGAPAALPVAITSPTDGAAVTGSIVVSGTTAPGADVSVSSAPADATTDATTVVDTAATGGRFRVTVPAPPGTDTITVAVTAGPRSSGWAQETVTGS